MKNLKKITLSILLTIAAIISVTAQSNKKTNLWKIEGDNIKTSYLFGTIHILPKSSFKISEKVKKAFDSCDRVTLELDMADPSFMADAMKLSMLEKDEELSSYMDASEYKLLDDYLKENVKVGLTAFNKLKPIALMSVIMMAKFKDEPLASYEMTFIEMSKTAKKDMDGLETYQDQLAAIDSQPYDEQIDTYIKMISEAEETDAIYNKMLKLYLAEDVDGIYDYTDEFMNGDIESKKRFLDDRNIKWIPKIGEFSREHSVFYGVGAAHLGGEQGVINLLKKAGYKVTPVLN